MFLLQITKIHINVQAHNNDIHIQQSDHILENNNACFTLIVCLCDQQNHKKNMTN